jgi:hypothetical protein
VWHARRRSDEVREEGRKEDERQECKRLSSNNRVEDGCGALERRANIHADRAEREDVCV